MSEFFAKSMEIAREYWPLFAAGTEVTLILSISGTVIGLLIGLFVGSVRAIGPEPRDSLGIRVLKRTVRIVTSIYIEVFRGTPMIVQGVFLFYLLKPVFDWKAMTAGVFVISVNTGAYMAEIIRSGIQSVDKGQTEAARSIGMTSFQTMFIVVLPQAIKNSFPSIGNEFVVNIKDSSVLSAISVTDLYFQSIGVAGSMFLFSQTMLTTVLIYLVLTFTTTRILGLIEKRISRPRPSLPSKQAAGQKA